MSLVLSSISSDCTVPASIASTSIFAMTLSSTDFKSFALLFNYLPIYVRLSYNSWSHSSFLKIVDVPLASLIATDLWAPRVAFSRSNSSAMIRIQPSTFCAIMLQTSMLN